MRMIIPIGMLIVMTHLQLVILHVIHLEGFCLFFSIIHYSLSSLCFPPWFSVCQSWHVIVWLAHLFHAFWVFCYMRKVCQIAIDRYWTIIYICIHTHTHTYAAVWLFATPWTVARQAPLSVGFSRQEYCSGLSFPSPGDLYDPESNHVWLTGGFFTNCTTWEARCVYVCVYFRIKWSIILYNL